MIDIYWSSKKSPVSNAPEICVALLDLHPVAWLIFGYIDYIWMVYIYGLDIGWIQMMYEFCMGYIFIYIYIYIKMMWGPIVIKLIINPIL